MKSVDFTRQKPGAPAQRRGRPPRQFPVEQRTITLAVDVWAAIDARALALGESTHGLVVRTLVEKFGGHRTPPR
jgi:hypothetical protein